MRSEPTAPRIALTLRRMIRIHPHAARDRARSAVLLSSVLALLACACLPAFAQADSSEVEYQLALPKADGGHSSHDEQIAESSESPGGAAVPAGSGSNGSGDGSSKVGDPSASGGGTATNGNDGGTGQGSQEKGATPSGGGKGKVGLQPADAVASTSAAPPVSDDGSSPLVPVLIAIAALAAVSFAAVAVRQRRQRGPRGPGGAGTSLSTKAG